MLINKSYTYVFPMIADIVNYEKDLLGCYIRDENRLKYTDHIFLRYKSDGRLNSAYARFEEEMQELPLLQEIYDIEKEGNNEVMFAFKVPERYRMDYSWFLDSKYSYLSAEYKKKVIDFHAPRHPNNRYILEGVLYRTSEYKIKLEEKIGEKLPPDSEFSSRWSKDREIFPWLGYIYTLDELVGDFDE